MTAPDSPEAVEKAREAFLSSIPDPPANTLVALAEGHADADGEEGDGDEPAPKAAKPAASTGKGAASQPSVSADAPLADRLVAALKAGDLDTIADLTDQDPAAFDEKSTKWAAKNRKESKLKAEIEKVRTDAAAVVEHWEPIDDRASRFASTKNYTLVKEMVELLTGEDWDSVAMKTFRAVRGEDPRVPALTKAVQEREEEIVQYKTKAEKASERALRETLRSDLPEDHQVRKLPDWEEKVSSVLRESVDADTGEPELSLKQAAARVVRTAREAYQKYAGVFSDEPRPARTRATTPERAAGSAPANKRKLSAEEFYSQFGK